MKTILIYFLIGIVFYFIINNNKNGFSIGGVSFRFGTKDSDDINTFDGGMQGGLFNGLGTITTADGTTIAGEFYNGQLTEGGTLHRADGVAWMGTFPVAMGPTGVADNANHMPPLFPWRINNASGVLIEPSTGRQWEGTFVNGNLHIGTMTDNDLILEGTFDAQGHLFDGTVTYPFGGVINISGGRRISLSCGVPAHQSWLARQGGDPGGGGAGTPGAGAPQWNPHDDLRRI